MPDSLREKAGLVLLGAVCAAVPALLNTQCSARAQYRAMLVDRRLAALRDYATACSRLTSAVTEFVSWDEKRQLLEKSRGLVPPPQQRYDDYILSRRDQVLSVIWAADAERDAARAAVIALYGTDMKSHELAVPTGSMRSRIPELQQQCEANVAMLAKEAAR